MVRRRYRMNFRHTRMWCTRGPGSVSSTSERQRVLFWLTVMLQSRIVRRRRRSACSLEGRQRRRLPQYHPTARNTSGVQARPQRKLRRHRPTAPDKDGILAHQQRKLSQHRRTPRSTGGVQAHQRRRLAQRRPTARSTRGVDIGHHNVPGLSAPSRRIPALALENRIHFGKLTQMLHQM
jgi:hypothetical protein